MAGPPATHCSSITNRTRLLQGTDGRTSSSRRYRDLVRAYEGEVGGVLNELERGLVRQAAALALRAEQMQSAIVRGEPVDTDVMIRLSSTCKRIVEAINAKAAKRRPSAPTLAEHLAKRSAERARASAEGDAV
jgi:hypothetical protein